MIHCHNDIGRWYAESQDHFARGECYIGVTSVLKYGIHYKLLEWFRKNSYNKTEKVMDVARTKGTDVHEAAELFLETDTPEILESEPAQASFEQFQLAREKHGIASSAQEFTVQHNVFGYAGTIDIIGAFDGKKCVQDIKTGKRYDITTGHQLAAYKYAYERMTGERDLGMVGIHCTEEEYHVFRYRNYDSCFAAFVSLMNAWRMKYFNELKKMNWQFLMAPCWNRLATVCVEMSQEG